MNSHSVFACVYNPNAIEIVARGRIWPGRLTTAIFKREGQKGEKKSKAFYSTQKTFKQESALATDKLGEGNSERLVPRVEGFTEQS